MIRLVVYEYFYTYVHLLLFPCFGDPLEGGASICLEAWDDLILTIWVELINVATVAFT